MQISDEYLDTCVAPNLSKLTACGAPEVAELPNYAFVLGMNNTLGPRRFKDVNARILLSSFIQRLHIATRAYRAGRDSLVRYVAALPQHNELSAFSLGLSEFETCVINLHVGLLCLRGAAARLDPAAVFPSQGDDDYDRLRKLSNRIKHFDQDVQKVPSGTALVPCAPIWITDVGMECEYRGEALPRPPLTFLTFVELAAILAALREDARVFSQDLFSGPQPVTT